MRKSVLVAVAVLAAVGVTSQLACNGTCFDYTEFYTCDCVATQADGGTTSRTTSDCARDVDQATSLAKSNCGCGTGCSCSCTCRQTNTECPNDDKARCH